ncbi:hypothetical protein FB451DRAFT_539661 [Mycena latifolia]|nr:hypothetical protein FB451DRAFT_539661 [Mycena latifolia]
MTFVVVDEEKENGLIENTTFTRNDHADIRGTPTSCHVPHPFPVEQQDFCSVLAEALRLDEGEIDWNAVQSPTHASQPNEYIDVDAIATEDSSISPSIQIPPPAECLHASSSHTPPTMRMAVPDVLATSPTLSLSLTSPGNVNTSRAKPHSDPARALAIPPSPRIPPPHPPNSPDPFDNVLNLGFPSPTLGQYSQASAEETRMERWIPAIPSSPSSRPLPHPPESVEISPFPRQNPNSVRASSSPGVVSRPPAVPPRSKLRPPPVKITTNFSDIRREGSEERGALELEKASPVHSRSPSIASLTISPLSTPPVHSRSASTASIMVSPMPTPPQHSHSSSISSSFIISPMPTPPPLSPTSPASTSGSIFPPLAFRRGRPVTPELDVRALRALILKRGGRSSSGRSSSGCESDHDSEVGESLEAIALAHRRSSDEHDDSSTCTVPTPEFAWQEEPRPPPSRLSFYESPESIHPLADCDDDDAASIYSQFSTTYTFRSRSRSTKAMRSVRRNGKSRRASRRSTTTMMSVYSQASFSSQHAMDLPSIPTLPSGLGGDFLGDVAENELGEMTFNAPEYAYAYSLDEYVGHGLESVALAGRTVARSGADFEAELTSTPLHKSGSSTGLSDDWRALLYPQSNDKGKRRTSSNISVVENGLMPDIPEVIPGLVFTDEGSLATNGSIGDISTTSTLTPMSPTALVPNRRQRTIRRIATSLPSSPRSNYQPPSSTSVNFVFDTETGRRDISSGESVPFPSLGPGNKLKKARGGSGLRGMRSRVRVLKSRLVSLTLAPRSPTSPRFPTSEEFYEHHPGLNQYLSPYPPTSPSATVHTPTSVSPTVSSSSWSSGPSTSAETSTPSSASSWNPRLTITGDTLFLSPTAAPATCPMAI